MDTLIIDLNKDMNRSYYKLYYTFYEGYIEVSYWLVNEIHNSFNIKEFINSEMIRK